MLASNYAHLEVLTKFPNYMLASRRLMTEIEVATCVDRQNNFLYTVGQSKNDTTASDYRFF